MIPQLRGPILSLLASRQPRIVFVDVGSRNGVIELTDVAPFVDAIGFEPNPQEYDKLVFGTTDLERLHGVASPPYRRLEYLPYALGGRSGRHSFYVTPGPGAAGLLEPDLERLREIVWKGRRFRPTFGDEIFAGYETIDVELRTLDEVSKELGVTYADYLKIDVEGSEYDVLSGAVSLLAATGVLKVEVGFVPQRKGQRLFSEVDLLLRPYGFDLLRYEVVQAQVGYKAREAPVEYLHDPLQPDPGGQPIAGDAIYVNRSVLEPERALAQGAVLCELGYVDEAHRVLRTHAGVDDGALLDVLRSARHGNLGTRLRLAGYRLVDRGVALGMRLRGRG